jgi:lipopolysaccharide export system permease protein
LSLPVLVRRDPKTMKSAIMISFFLSSSCFLVTAGCKMMATEPVFQRFIPEFWAWLPIFIYLPIAFLEIDAMKT